MIFIVICIICIVLLLVLEGGNKKEKIADYTYEQDLEKRLYELISALEGVNNVRVMVTVEGGTEYVYAEDKENTENGSRSQYYSAGDEEALLLKKIYPTVQGVAVVCNSRSPSVTQSTVIKLISGVLDLPTNRIFVDAR